MSSPVICPTRPGQVIFLNGTSSSGKSSIAGQLLLAQLTAAWRGLSSQ